jgi:2-dehydro-3-deoxygluconokinase
LVAALSATFPNLRSVAATSRRIHSGSRHDLGGWLWHNDEFITGREWVDVEVEDRIGSGDAFAAGILFGLLTGRPAMETLDLALAHAVLAHTTRGDTSQFTLEEVLHAANVRGAAMQR